MKWIDTNHRVPIKSWSEPIEEGGMKQAVNLTMLPFMYRYVALMADCLEGFGMPIGGVWVERRELTRKKSPRQTEAFFLFEIDIIICLPPRNPMPGDSLQDISM
jgi:hypothetical protein